MSESDLPAFAQATSGAMGSLVSNTLVYPLDLLSTRLQTQSRARAGSSKVKKAQPSLIGALQEIVKTSGIGGLYQGLGSDSLSNTLSNFLFFYFRGFLMDLLHKRHDRLHPPTSNKEGKSPAFTLSASQDLAVGALAGIASRFFTTPLSNVTVRKQTSSSVTKKDDSEKPKKPLAGDDDDSSDDEDGEYGDGPSILDVLKEIVNDKGFVGLWSGFETAALLSVTPALTFSFTTLFTKLLPKSSQEHPSATQTFLTSAGGNALSTFLLFPLILSKTRLQWKSPSGKKMYKNLVDVLRKTIKKNGIKGLYQGLESQLVKGLIGHGMTMMVKQRVEALFITVFLLLRDRARSAKAIAN